MYTECVLPMTEMDAQSFLQSDPEEMRRRFEAVIQTEGPILDSLLEKRVLRSYGLVKRGSRIRPLMDRILEAMDTERTWQVSADGKRHAVYWPESYRGKDKATFTECRIPSDRDIMEIPLCEVANLMRSIGVKQKTKLFNLTAKQLGYARKGANIRKTFALAYPLI
ncbi:MAG: DUF3320 domain-containing protein [Sphaerochaeta sp.]|jgi:hypothetical protein|nr:DUF3320 domain-containing protein [Sphaerochaeta sp.]MCH3920983.1 DUF3320 domain-containing protein [Sphaerochaeta sp.]MCI2045240.1 DUF3320 domain-containing protein [Sphaerochaeta sp.]MCI2075867.1 DUF3320 domain-containing protein [Sphaerochaeta sp.]MCI2097133.1 DUF3320 domain-containing protein [Sphaerochaeta sp.]